MTIKELNKDQMIMVKQNYYCEQKAQEGVGVSCLELSNIDNLVSDEKMYEVYASTEFYEDDFGLAGD